MNHGSDLVAIIPPNSHDRVGNALVGRYVARNVLASLSWVRCVGTIKTHNVVLIHQVVTQCRTDQAAAACHKHDWLLIMHKSSSRCFTRAVIFDKHEWQWVYQ